MVLLLICIMVYPGDWEFSRDPGVGEERKRPDLDAPEGAWWGPTLCPEGCRKHFRKLVPVALQKTVLLDRPHLKGSFLSSVPEPLFCSASFLKRQTRKAPGEKGGVAF